MIQPYILRRTKAEALKLPPKVGGHCDVARCVTTHCAERNLCADFIVHLAEERVQRGPRAQRGIDPSDSSRKAEESTARRENDAHRHQLSRRAGTRMGTSSDASLCTCIRDGQMTSTCNIRSPLSLSLRPLLPPRLLCPGLQIRHSCSPQHLHVPHQRQHAFEIERFDRRRRPGGLTDHV